MRSVVCYEEMVSKNQTTVPEKFHLNRHDELDHLPYDSKPSHDFTDSSKCWSRRCSKSERTGWNWEKGEAKEIFDLPTKTVKSLLMIILQMIILSQMISVTTLGNCLEDQPSLRNPGTSQHCESFSAERRGSKQKEEHKVIKKEQLSHNLLTFQKETD